MNPCGSLRLLLIFASLLLFVHSSSAQIYQCTDCYEYVACSPPYCAGAVSVTFGGSANCSLSSSRTVSYSSTTFNQTLGTCISPIGSPTTIISYMYTCSQNQLTSFTYNTSNCTGPAVETDISINNQCLPDQGSSYAYMCSQIDAIPTALQVANPPSSQQLLPTANVMYPSSFNSGISALPTNGSYFAELSTTSGCNNPNATFSSSVWQIEDGACYTVQGKLYGDPGPANITSYSVQYDCSDQSFTRSEFIGSCSAGTPFSRSTFPIGASGVGSCYLGSIYSCRGATSPSSPSSPSAPPTPSSGSVLYPALLFSYALVLAVLLM